MGQAPEQPTANPWPALSEAIAEQYDQSGVPWFQPIAHTLLGLLEPVPGERFLELGAGRGALTFPLAEAVAPGGEVTAPDADPAEDHAQSRRPGRSNGEVVTGRGPAPRGCDGSASQTVRL